MRDETAIPSENPSVLPRSKWWWIALCLLLLLAAWLYLRGYQVGLPFFEHSDEAMHLLAAQHIVDFGWENGILQQYAPGMKTLNYLFLKHVKPADAHHGTMLPALRLISISAWMLTIVMIALLGAMIIHPVAGLAAAIIWIVNPWVVERAHFALMDAYLTMFTMLALWLALVGLLQFRRSFSTAAVYSIMLATVFKTQALFVAPIIVFLPLLNWWRRPARRGEAWRQTFGNCLRFAIFLFWLLLIYPTLEADKIPYFAMSYDDMGLPSLESAWASLQNVWRPFPWTNRWGYVAIAGALLLRYRRRVNITAFSVIFAAGIAWMLGMSMFQVQHIRHYFAVGAMLAILYGCGMTGLLLAAGEALSGLKLPFLSPRRAEALASCAVLMLVIYNWLPSYRESDALAHSFTLRDRRNDLAQYMDASLPPGKFISDRDDPNHVVFNRSWGGYDGLHDFPLAQEIWGLLDEPLETWRGEDAVYAILPYPSNHAEPDIYFPEQTVLLKGYPPDPDYRGPSMVVLRLYPMQHEADAQLGPIRLLGYDINATELRAGDELVFRHYWRAENATATPLRVFNHLIDGSGQLAAQTDYIPLFDGRRDTSAWDDPEEILLGREFRLRTSEGAPPGEYTLITGFYDPQTGIRLTAADGADSIRISHVNVLPAQ